MSYVMPTPEGQHDLEVPPQPSLLEATLYWLKLGFISFGGPAGQIAIMHQDLVDKKRWISEKRFLHALNYCMVLPGPEAQQLATYIGWLMHRTLGGIIAGTLFVLPSLAILILLTWLYLAYGHQPQIEGVLYGIKPAVVAIVVFAAYRIGSRALKNGVLWAISAGAFLGIALFNLPFPLIILIAATLGLMGSRWLPGKFTIQNKAHTQAHGPGKAVIDDQTPTPAHAVFNLSKFILLIVIALGIWAGALGLLVLQYGLDSVLVKMGWFFTKAALLTFGGAYAVLPYVYQGAVQTYEWLTPVQMIDGLALGETTPGPLIMVVAFVGFVGGWSQTIFGSEHLLLGGVVAACVTTFFTFLPSFLFIFIGGPLVESTQGDLRFTAPLTAITAAVVGVILNLAVFFAYHVFWPNGISAAIDPVSIAAAVISALLLFRWKFGIVPLILLSGVFGLAYRMLL
jgi:chromate transporter